MLYLPGTGCFCLFVCFSIWITCQHWGDFLWKIWCSATFWTIWKCSHIGHTLAWQQFPGCGRRHTDLELKVAACCQSSYTIVFLIQFSWLFTLPAWLLKALELDPLPAVVLCTCFIFPCWAFSSSSSTICAFTWCVRGVC